MFVKICGITNEDDALLATALDADALGFVFAPSPRQVHPETVRDIVRRLPREVHTIGVFRDERPERIVEIVGRAGLRGVQLHGHEPASEVKWIRERVQFVIQAFTAGDPALATAGRARPTSSSSTRPIPGRARCSTGGSPRARRASAFLSRVASPGERRDAIRLVRPWGVDVSSGVEREPGRKDPGKLRRFVVAAREAAAEVEDRAIDLTVDEVGGVTRPWDWQIDA